LIAKKGYAAMLDAIKNRRSIRRFKKQAVDEKFVKEIIEAGTWAPSGLNNQPWKFVVVRSPEVKDKIAELTRYRKIIQEAPLCIAVFLDTALSYDRTKDIQAIGACIQNILLAIHALNLGGVWLGEILKNSEKVKELLGVSPALEFMAVIALGYPAEKNVTSQRKKLDEVILSEV
jgi:nitroreductase